MRAAALAIGFVSVVPALAHAQTDRVFVSINGGQQFTKNPFTDSFTFEVNRETGTTATDYPIGSGLVVDAGVAVRVWRNLSAGVAVSNFTRDDAAQTRSEVPHPLFFDMPREVEGQVDARRTERGVHVQVSYRAFVTRSVQLALFGGPSFIRLEQEIVSDVAYDEGFPYDTATFRSARTRSVSGSAVGFNAGADGAWMFNRYVGIGGVLRYASAAVDLELHAGRSRTLDAGGFSAGGGLRLAF